MFGLARARGLAVLVPLALSLAPAVDAATTRIGAVQEIETATAPFDASSGGDGVQLAEAVGSYAVPTGYGVITAWEHSTGTAGGSLSFKAYRPLGGGSFFTVASDTRTVTPGLVHTFSARIPVRPGDRLGLSAATDTVQIAYQTFNPADQFAFFPVDSNPQAGTTVAQDGPVPASGLKLDVAARVETDADGDGFGDDSQDRCPTSATTQGACPAGSAGSPADGPAPQRAFPGCRVQTNRLLEGTPGANALTGSAGADRIFALAGNDAVAALAGNDCLDLGAGSDRGDGGPGNDLVAGGSGNDRLVGAAGGDRLLGGTGADRIAGGTGADVLDGGSGGDVLDGGSGRDRISGGAGRDRIDARDRRRDRVTCGPGRDTVRADRVDRVARDCERVQRR